MSERAGFEVQGHRGARGLRPENSLAGFELALDLGVTSIETDVHLTRDGVPVLIHDPRITGRLCSRRDGGVVPERRVSELSLAELRAYRADRNPQPGRFPAQIAAAGPLSVLFAANHGLDPWTIPTLADLFAFAAAYAGSRGEHAGKTSSQRQRAAQLIFDMELKRMPFEPANIGDHFDGSAPALLERHVLEEVERAGVIDRVRVRSFDHRSARCMRQLQPRLPTALLLGAIAPIRPADLLAAADAQMYCPYYCFVDRAIVQQVHDADRRIMPWTANEPEAWERLVALDVDGITTDYPDRLLEWLRQRGIRVA
jgi:glycerophosphoryl diester phosphodiesterase